MALRYIGFDGTAEPDALRGLNVQESGYNTESFELEYMPAVRDKLAGITGEPRAFAVSEKASAKLSIKGEIMKASVGSLASNFYTVFVPVETHTTLFGRTGGFYIVSANVHLNRNDWYKGGVECESDPLIA